MEKGDHFLYLLKIVIESNESIKSFKILHFFFVFSKFKKKNSRKKRDFLILKN